ncbi:metallophosphoesterase [Roseovarius sp. EL26]|uniref:metallophosphoesterase family protein n=1 Tax=Roseovarius sp. EL26 TaxID=2126672 RepID=UPI0013C41678|nr:metallophosphoesterase family protein [Roseovarius sp. EL26]
MVIRDLGQQNDPLLLFGGPYSNLQALTALRKQAEKQAISSDRMICTGDVVAYCSAPHETVKMIRDLGCPIVAGNCEKQLAARQDNCGCGFDAGSTCDLLSAGWYAHANLAVTDDDRVWMRNLPDIVVFTHFGRRFAVIHGGVSEISRFIWPVSVEEVFEQEVAQVQAIVGLVNGIIAGHSGIAFLRHVAGVEWINAGVIGMPANAGVATTQYITMCEGQAQIHALNYDHQAEQKAMRAAGLTQGYHDALVSGYWPSEDVLPSDLRRAVTASG